MQFPCATGFGVLRYQRGLNTSTCQAQWVAPQRCTHTFKLCTTTKSFWFLWFPHPGAILKGYPQSFIANFFGGVGGRYWVESMTMKCAMGMGKPLQLAPLLGENVQADRWMPSSTFFTFLLPTSSRDVSASPQSCGAGEVVEG